MELQTRLTVPEVPNPISYSSETLLLGSCFAGHMAEKLTHYQFRNTLNPFGTLFHPRAISSLVHRALEGREFTEEDCIFHLERWHSYEVHSDMSRGAKEELLRDLNRELVRTKELLTGISHLTLTLGTAWGYRRKDSDSWVANCHKVPQKEFDKVLSSPDEIVSALHSALSLVYRVNPGISVILTVSPVRHIKDGFVENQRSKAHLIVSVHRLLEEFAEREICYFPAYELMMDELRDYRFYGSDMLHPSETAVDYIWERFKSAGIDQRDYKTMAAVEDIRKRQAHRPFNPGSQAHKAFTEDLQQKIDALRLSYPFMTFD